MYTLYSTVQYQSRVATYVFSAEQDCTHCIMLPVCPVSSDRWFDDGFITATYYQLYSKRASSNKLLISNYKHDPEMTSSWCKDSLFDAVP
jgi:hypothetical protein